MLSPGAPGFFPLWLHRAQAEGTDAMADLPFCRLRAGADPAAPAGSAPVALLLVLKMIRAHHGEPECRDHGREGWLRMGCVLGKERAASCAAAALPLAAWVRGCSPLPCHAGDVLSAPRTVLSPKCTEDCDLLCPAGRRAAPGGPSFSWLYSLMCLGGELLAG